MSKKDKWLFALWGIFVAFAVATHIWTKEYGDILWVLNITFLLWLLWKQSKLIQKLDKTIADQCDVIFDYSISNTQMHINHIEKKLECAQDNCKTYLGRIGELKLENEQLRIMNKNLIETKFKGKAYGRKKL